ncbi:carboxypeptidase regulatory-like domain-containing protein [Flavitalea sp. BT771]|uniref:TonB-dependent receptor n=1 Tax=Flavitalea sp. BT771 TaxID=3063329 RepID=UPI0026E3B93F|nr:TonB-dependent receptor [Flavitalea sp. BT771]MDO6430980.1 carboxypeptidase regulatory-like domain-containing protein [Flavitalea sp. BT771]MDV6219887.1 carboxypeptidase regulatory-like domain-containing protein [Flavitalea sp. BT771]
MIKRLLLSAFTVLCVFFTFGQETTSQILGTVTGDQGALAGATVTALHTPTGTRYTTTTRKDGRFNLPNVRVGGPYVLTISYVGFKEEKQDNINLVVGQDFTADFKMTAESRQLTEVVVAGSRQQNKIFNNSRTGSQEIVVRSQIERLPTIQRSIQDFARLEPSSNGLSFGGTSGSMNNITVDGADFNNSFGLSGTLGGQANAQPISLDAIDQIQVNVAPYDVRQGGFTGAGVNSVTRSGTNQVRGSVYTYIKGPGTIGYNVENTKVLRTPFTYNVAGFSIGGAIIPSKVFYFISAEQSKQSAPATNVLPSDASHPSASGSVSQSSVTILDSIRSFVKNKYGYNTGDYTGYSFKTNSYKINARIDINVNAYNTLTLKYNYLKSYADQFPSTSRPNTSMATGGIPTSNGNPLPFYGSGYRINNNLNIYIAELNTRFGNKASNKLQVGYTRERDFRTPQSSSPTFPLVDILSNGNIYTTFGYEMYTYNNVLNMDSYQLTDIFSMYKGAHEITFGTQDSYKKYTNAFAPGFNSVYQFASLADFVNGAPAQYFYQQYSALKGGAFPFAYAGATNLSLFAQDKWRVTPTFTFTYGVRFDYTSYQNKFTRNDSFAALSFLNGAKYDVGSAPNGFLVVSPRVGFNWDVTGDRTWQLRGGAGIFEGAPPFVWIENQAANNGVQFGSFAKGSSTANSGVIFNPDPAAQLATQLGSTPQTNTPKSYSVNIIDKHFKYPTKLRTSVGLDKKLPNDWLVTGEFTYSKDINAPYMSNVNLNESNGFAITNGPDNRTRFLTSVSNTNKYYSAGSSLLNPNIGNAILLANTNKGYAYVATARVQKTWHNLIASLAYTYTETKSAIENGSTASSLWSARAVANTDPNAATLSHPGWYQPHRIIAYANYRIEEGSHTSTSIGAVYEATTAGSTSYVYNGDLNGDGNSGNDLIYIPRNASEINLVQVNSVGSNATNATLDHSDTRSAAQIWTQLNNFINQDHYMSRRRGKYAQANSVMYPWYKHLDLNVTQDIYFYTKNNGTKDKHTLRLSVDIVNVGNLINRNWGLIKSPTAANFLKFEGMAADGKTPLFSFPYADAGNQVPITNSFANNTNLTNFANNQTFTGSRWQMQFGIRYLFN